MFDELNRPDINVDDFFRRILNALSDDTDLSEDEKKGYKRKLNRLKDQIDFNFEEKYKEIIFGKPDDIYKEDYDNIKFSKDDWNNLNKWLKKSNLKEEIYEVSHDNESDRYICPVCGLEMHKANEKSIQDMDKTAEISIDHVLPKSKYEEYIFYLNNLVPMCSSCNNHKGNKINNNIYHPYYHTNHSISCDDIRVKFNQDNTKKRKIPVRICYYLESDDAKRKEIFRMYNISSTYEEMIYKKEIWEKLDIIIKGKEKELSKKEIVDTLKCELRLRNKSYKDDVKSYVIELTLTCIEKRLYDYVNCVIAD